MMMPWRFTRRHRRRWLVTGRGRMPSVCIFAAPPFQMKVWEALLHIPRGALASYDDVAAAIGAPRASRAVASAIAVNPVAVLIPCHRVIRQTGHFGGYTWG